MDTPEPKGFAIAAMRSCPFPTRLLERCITLDETSLRLICLIVRSSLGWASVVPGERKATGTFTLWQLTKRIKRTSTVSVTNALTALTQEGLIVIYVTDGGGHSLADLGANKRRLLSIGIDPAWVEG